LNDIGKNSLLGNRKKIAKFLMRTFTCRSTFLYGCEGLFMPPFLTDRIPLAMVRYRADQLRAFGKSAAVADDLMLSVHKTQS
jgi:hypothetical protein